MKPTILTMMGVESMRTKDDQEIGFVWLSIGIKAFALRTPRSGDEANDGDDNDDDEADEERR
jgi:hypothetical protein